MDETMIQELTEDQLFQVVGGKKHHHHSSGGGAVNVNVGLTNNVTASSANINFNGRCGKSRLIRWGGMRATPLPLLALTLHNVPFDRFG